MEAIHQVLAGFEPINLEQMDNVRLMDRMDTKFTFRIEQLPIFLEQLSDDYRVLEVANSRISRYETLYYDTEDFQLYLKHQNGKSNRYKIRFRKYVESDLNFFEIKFKNNKGRTIKDRIRRGEIEYRLGGEVQHLLSEKTPLDPGSLIPKLWVNYSRITLVNKSSRERLTIDINLNFRNETCNRYFNNLVVAEVKQEKSSSSPFIKIMKQNHIREGSISKYCLGVILLYEQIKKNNFKPMLLVLNKVIA